MAGSHDRRSPVLLFAGRLDAELALPPRPGAVWTSSVRRSRQCASSRCPRGCRARRRSRVGETAAHQRDTSIWRALSVPARSRRCSRRAAPDPAAASARGAPRAARTRRPRARGAAPQHSALLDDFGMKPEGLRRARDAFRRDRPSPRRSPPAAWAARRGAGEAPCARPSRAGAGRAAPARCRDATSPTRAPSPRRGPRAAPRRRRAP